MEYIVQHHLRYKLGNSPFEYSPRLNKSFESLSEAQNYIKTDNQFTGSDTSCRYQIVPLCNLQIINTAT